MRPSSRGEARRATSACVRASSSYTAAYSSIREALNPGMAPHLTAVWKVTPRAKLLPGGHTRTTLRLRGRPGAWPLCTAAHASESDALQSHKHNAQVESSLQSPLTPPRSTPQHARQPEPPHTADASFAM